MPGRVSRALATHRIHLDSLRRVLRNELEGICASKQGEVVSRCTWIPETCFCLFHAWAWLTLIYGLCWTYTAAIQHELPKDLKWKPMELFKLSYPMLPVIIGCQFRRWNFCSTNRRMSPGYYFANLKMGLLPSLGPGFLIGVVLDKLVVRPSSFGVDAEYRELILPLSWFVGFFTWRLVGPCLPAHTEQNRKDWGRFAAWHIDPSFGKPLQDWVKRGSPFVMFFIQAPIHGTFHKVTQANAARVVGITGLCIILWSSALLWWSIWSTPSWKNWWTTAMAADLHWCRVFVQTGFVNLIVNAITAPFLIGWTWRCEPDDATLHQASVPRYSATEQEQPLQREGNFADTLEELAEIVSKMPLEAVLDDPTLTRLLLSSEFDSDVTDLETLEV
eukprot:TRINITY_DN6003_c0_g1_i2.p1 TRINITY_DN6003_c0_g1~~TRINITY_DN6003_c0_g1_i2.p1  ORF type:complete len:406 (-),score=35.47 TRINITY_DN6003_c0_g1_i2:113-1279(-)